MSIYEYVFRVLLVIFGIGFTAFIVSVFALVFTED